MAQWSPIYLPFSYSPTGPIKANEVMKREKSSCCFTQTAYGLLVWLHMAALLRLHLLLCIVLSSYHLGNYEVSLSPSFFCNTSLKPSSAVFISIRSINVLNNRCIIVLVFLALGLFIIGLVILLFYCYA